MRIALLALLLATIATACASPGTLGAHAILPSNAVDTKDAWIYLQSEEAANTGVYRCYDRGGRPVCVKAALEEESAKK